MRCLDRFPDVLPVSLADLTYDLSIRTHHGASVGGIGTLLSPANVHLQGPINAANTQCGHYIHNSLRELEGQYWNIRRGLVCEIA